MLLMIECGIVYRRGRWKRREGDWKQREYFPIAQTSHDRSLYSYWLDITVGWLEGKRL